MASKYFQYPFACLNTSVHFDHCACAFVPLPLAVAMAVAVAVHGMAFR